MADAGTDGGSGDTGTLGDTGTGYQEVDGGPDTSGTGQDTDIDTDADADTDADTDSDSDSELEEIQYKPERRKTWWSVGEEDKGANIL